MGEIRLNPAYKPFAQAEQPLQIAFGGSSSGKSRFIAQRLVMDLAQGKRNYIAVRKIARSLRDSVWKEINQVIDSAEAGSKFKLNKTEMTATCIPTKKQVVCFGLDNVEKLKSILPEHGVFTDAWVEEATEITQDDLRQLQRRMRGKAEVSKRITMSFNPIFRDHWIAKKYFPTWADQDTFYQDKEILILKTTYKDNRFLDPFEIKILEDETDQYWHDVYTLGNWGVLGDLIFKNWRIEDVRKLSNFYTFDTFRNGLDFGYSVDPNAFVRLYYHHALKKIYITDDKSRNSRSYKTFAKRRLCCMR
jgi:phage terminase large subunit